MPARAPFTSSDALGQPLQLVAPTFDGVRALVQSDDIERYQASVRAAIDSHSPFAVQHRIYRGTFRDWNGAPGKAKTRAAVPPAAALPGAPAPDASAAQSRPGSRKPQLRLRRGKTT